MGWLRRNAEVLGLLLSLSLSGIAAYVSLTNRVTAIETKQENTDQNIKDMREDVKAIRDYLMPERRGR